MSHNYRQSSACLNADLQLLIEAISSAISLCSSQYLRERYRLTTSRSFSEIDSVCWASLLLACAVAAAAEQDYVTAELVTSRWLHPNLQKGNGCPLPYFAYRET